MTALGYRMRVTETGRAEGIHHGAEKLIDISDRLEPNGRLAAGIHEVGHALVALDDLAPRLSYAEEELIVESVACASWRRSTDRARSSGASRTTTTTS